MFARRVLPVLLAFLVSTACGGDDPAAGPDGSPARSPEREDLRRIVVQKADLARGYGWISEAPQPLEELAGQFPGLRGAGFVAAHRSLFVIGKGPHAVSIATLFADAAAAGKGLAAFREGYRVPVGPTKVTVAEVSPPPLIGEEAFALEIRSDASGWVIAWRAGPVVCVLQAARESGVPMEEALSLTRPVATRLAEAMTR